ncbi:hypothetical protein K8T06_01205 [bacterium]|nr:hypothetical protein [bacterium]
MGTSGGNNALAEGTVRAAEILNMGQERVSQLFPAWGYAGHWDGHGDHINQIFFPFWIFSALQWAMNTRDQISSGHGYVQNIGVVWRAMVCGKKPPPPLRGDSSLKIKG